MNGGSVERGSRMRSSEAPVGNRTAPQRGQDRGRLVLPWEGTKFRESEATLRLIPRDSSGGTSVPPWETNFSKNPIRWRFRGPRE